MRASYNLVNFTLRPAKAAERKMIVDICARLGAFSKLLNFRYIGLGSPFFNDFVALHRRYGIANMICIERVSQDKDRFSFNRPFDCIDIQWGESTDVLPRLQWNDIPTIIWMDYDDPINEEMLADIGTIVRQVEPGSLVLFTIQAKGTAFGSEDKSPLQDLQEQIGDFLPIDVTETDMQGKAFQKLIRRIFNDEVNRQLSHRNAGTPTANAIRYRQLFNALYSDGVRMTTIGGVVYRADQEQVLTSCEFSDFEFLRENNVPFEITIPVLTYREQMQIASKLPSGTPRLSFVKPGDLENFRKLYRYYPTFMETEL